jgi:hypothetical protein
MEENIIECIARYLANHDIGDEPSQRLVDDQNICLYKSVESAFLEEPECSTVRGHLL